jgi:adenosylhomocysteinase
MTQAFSSISDELDHYDFCFPIMAHLSDFLKSSRLFEGSRIGWHCHLTALTAAAARVFLESGCRLYMSECNRTTTDPAAVAFMESAGAAVYLGEDGPAAVLEHEPEIISDTGFVLSSCCLEKMTSGCRQPLAACEITTSGVQRMRSCGALPFPVININDCRLKTAIENYHGVGDGVSAALARLSGRLWTGRRVAVVGYGQVGAGVADHMRRQQAQVQIVERDPVRRLLAHYDGFVLTDLQAALATCELVVTATGSKSVVSREEFLLCRDGLILMNVGHFAEEIDLKALRQLSRDKRELVKDLLEFEIGEDAAAARKVYLAGGAGPANVVMLTGSPEPTLIHLATEILSCHYLLSCARKLSPGENPLPAEVEQQASLLALKSLGLD